MSGSRVDTIRQEMKGTATVHEVTPAATKPLIAAGVSILVFAAKASHSFLPVGGDGQYHFYLVSAISAELCPAL